MKRRLLLSLLLLASAVRMAAAGSDAIEDITARFTGCWNSAERATRNADGTITYVARQWGGLAYWVDDDWSDYERLVFEFAKAAPCDVQAIVGYPNDVWGRNYVGAGVMEVGIDLDESLKSHVMQVALQAAADATLTVKRIYLVKVQAEPGIDPNANPSSGANNRLMINELMQSNIDCTMDDLNDFPDSWVELLNDSREAVNLSQYRLGVTSSAAEAWPLPDVTVGPGLRTLVYCDKVGNGLHAPFRLESGKGCEVFLFKGTELTDHVGALKKQPAPNTAYGRKTDGSSEWGYQLVPTPGGANSGEVCDHDHVLGDPVFSEPGRVLTGSHTLRLTLSLPEGTPQGAEIRYTTNGTEPTAASTLYSQPLSISSTTVVRARVFCRGWLSPCSVTQSYIFFPRRLTLPVISIATDSRYLNNSKIGIFANNDGDHRNNWRRPVNLEFFAGEGEASSLNQLCETRISGAASRGHAKKSMTIYANKRFGTKRFAYEFFPDQRPGVTDFKSLVLRNAGNDFDYLYMRDAIVQRTMAAHTDLDWQAWRPAIVYINGTYHSMLNIRERANEDNVYTHYDGLEDIDLIENNSELKEGTWDNFNRFKAFYRQKGHTLAEYAEWMDWEEYINLMVMNLYFNNQDFPGNNIIAWRPRAEGGRWRWIAKDTDFALGLYGTPASYKTLQWLYNPNFDRDHNWGANSSSATELFRNLMENADFKRQFLDRAAIYMGDFLNEAGTREVWDAMYEEIREEYPNHRKLVNQWWPDYSTELSTARAWLKNRTDEFYAQLGSYYQEGSPIPVSIAQDGAGEGKAGISFNGIRLSKGGFSGRFFANHDIVLEGLEADGADGAVVSGWRVVQVSGSSTTVETVQGSVLRTTMPQCSGLQIVALVGMDTDGIRLPASAEVPAAGVYDLNGRLVRRGSTSLDGLPRGVYIVGGKKVVK